MGTRKLKSVSKPGIKEVWSMCSLHCTKKGVSKLYCAGGTSPCLSLNKTAVPLLKHFLICKQHEQVIWRLLACKLSAAVNPLSCWMPQLPSQCWIRETPLNSRGLSFPETPPTNLPCCPGLFTACNSHQPSQATALLRDKTGQCHALTAPGQPFCRRELNPI